jgi:hypothetical protein
MFTEDNRTSKHKTASICMPMQLSAFQRDLRTNVTVNNLRKVTNRMPVKMKNSIFTFVYSFYEALSKWIMLEVLGRTDRPLYFDTKQTAYETKKIKGDTQTDSKVMS